jgi:ubiquinol-cytochrome c reductase cytochrome b subunit
MIQLVTGVILVSLISLQLDIAFTHLYSILTENWYVWIVRDIHMLGSNLSMFLLYLHMMKALSADLLTIPRASIWLSGATILLLSLGVCFTGYILVTGQMSYWALIVILNLVTVIPVLDEIIVSTVLAGSHPTSWSIGRIYSLHFLLAIVTIGLVLVHLNLIHRARPSVSSALTDSSYMLSDVTLKDLLLLAPCLWLLSCPIMSTLIHPDNWLTYDAIATPAHIEPEVYFLWLFCLLKSRASKVAGVLFFIVHPSNHPVTRTYRS